MWIQIRTDKKRNREKENRQMERGTQMMGDKENGGEREVGIERWDGEVVGQKEETKRRENMNSELEDKRESRQRGTDYETVGFEEINKRENSGNSGRIEDRA